MVFRQENLVAKIMNEIKIGGFTLGNGHLPFVVAEAGINHNGDLDRALAMVTAAKEAGCDAVKFATLKADEFCNPSHMITYKHEGEIVTEPEIEMFRRSELPDSAWITLKEECDRHGILFFSTPQNESDLKLLLDVGVPAIKIGSDDLTNLKLIASYASHNIPLIMSTGMADHTDIYAAANVARASGCDKLIFCVCTSEYPCPPEHANLARIGTLKRTFTHIGFSDHTIGTDAAIIAATLGACYLETHFTLDNQLRGPDHAFSKDPKALKQWVDAIRNVRTMLGDWRVRPTDVEIAQRTQWRRKSGQKIRGS